MKEFNYREVAAFGGLGLSRIVPVVTAWGLPVSEPLRQIAMAAGGKLNRVAPDGLAAVLSHRPKLGDVHNTAGKDYYFAQAMRIGVVLCELDEHSDLVAPRLGVGHLVMNFWESCDDLVTERNGFAEYPALRRLRTTLAGVEETWRAGDVDAVMRAENLSSAFRQRLDRVDARSSARAEIAVAISDCAGW